MLVTMRTRAAGPDGVLLPGVTYDLPDDQGQALLDGGFATSPDAGTVPPVQAPQVAEEPEDQEPLTEEQEEDVTQPRGRRRS